MAGKKIVLAIDDNLVQLNAFKSILNTKFDVCTATSASNAVNYMNNNKVDVVLLDIEMPNISGFDFLNDIRRIPSYMNVPIIIVSGKTGKEFFDKAKKTSAFDVLSKPVIPDILVKTIENALTSRE